MKKNRILALALPVLLALASCDNNLIEQPEQGGGSGNGSDSADQPAYIVNAEGDTLYLVTPTVEMAPTPALTRAEQETKTYNMGHGMTMQVIPDAPKDTRSLSALKVGTLVRMYVYDSNDAYIDGSMRQYSVGSDGKFTQTGTDGGLYLPMGNYTVYCFTDAANTTGTWATDDYTIDISNKTVTVPQGADAAWGSGTVKVGMYNPNKLTAVLERKCAQISSITLAGDATVSTMGFISGQTCGLLPVKTATSAANFGDLDGTKGTGQAIIDISNAPNTSKAPALSYQLSGPIYLIPKEKFTGTRVVINVILNGYGYYSAFFSLYDDDGNVFSPLAGQSYKVIFNVHSGGIFAHSNIFWDGNTLNFYTNEDELARSESGAPNGPTADAAKDYQGVFFKWSSLIGISPAASNASGSYGYDNTVTIYVPKIQVANSGYNGYLQTSGKDYDKISYDNTTDNAGILYSKYGILNDGNNQGDICAYLTEGKWRMPTIQEINVTNQAAGTDLSSWGETALTSGIGWWRSGTWNDVTSVSPFPTNTEDGMRDLSATGHAHLRTDRDTDVNLPAGGYYNSVAASSTLHNDAGNNYLYGVGVVVNYWSGTPDNSATAGTTGVYLAAATWFIVDSSSSQTHQQPESHGARDYAFPVRCVTAY
ncbi:MAG: hypothetical protein LBN24_10990 [Mediterranea sp.]|jgi:hypothetical protein|nr:hypothetical protein [Mediterranea sp.]